MVYSRLARIHFDQSQKRIQIFDILHFPIGPTGGSENLQTSSTGGGELP